MKLSDIHCDQYSTGSTVETWDSKIAPNLAISIADAWNSEKSQTATLSPEDCIALGIYLLLHAKKHGYPIPSF